MTNDAMPRGDVPAGEQKIPEKHLLPQLPYAYGALEPYIDARTMSLHHGKHHASYVLQLNTALEKHPGLQRRTPTWLLSNLAEVPSTIRSAVQHNAGGHLNHSLFWRAMAPTGVNAPTGAFADAIVRDFGSLEKLKARFVEVGEKQFASGWVWLARAQADGKLQVLSTSGHDNPIQQGHYPILVNDVWEHAYYLKYENRRVDYLKHWWAVANWAEAARRYEGFDLSAQNGLEANDGSVFVESQRAAQGASA